MTFSLHTKALIFAACAVVALGALSGCESDEQNDLAQAQECFNNLDDSAAPASANVCLNYIAGYTSTEAYSMKCGILSWQGGLTTTNIISAFDQYKAAPKDQKESTLMYALVMTSPSAAAEAYTACAASKVAGLIYISGLSKLATDIENTVGGANGSDLVSNCLSNPSTCVTAENGQVLVTAGEQYCSGGSASDDVCEALNQAIGSAPSGDYAQILQNFLSSIQ